MPFSDLRIGCYLILEGKNCSLTSCHNAVVIMVISDLTDLVTDAKVAQRGIFQLLLEEFFNWLPKKVGIRSRDSFTLEGLGLDLERRTEMKFLLCAQT